ncbi:helix-turn-helix domain-containing protein [Actinomadura opuntiae]|uniref:helix-turn-helix domain-containing protein n=1 Tax=Actinomadura sp. OS1-43 TaxID=604315 RepID=UPI00255AC208|nr:helix-turn-helix domain-containing protein [Actinomadura sp. OS1-43]MDL4812724.1 helix-turn-helix domain-containing protein [Actinomadura sp. OS1-43]
MAIARSRKGLTLEELADLCGQKGAPISKGQLSRIERGAVPRPALRKVLAEILELDAGLDFPRAA